MNKIEALIKVGYYVELSGSYGKKILWEVLDNSVVEEVKDYDKIGPQVFFCFLMKTRRELLEKD